MALIAVVTGNGAILSYSLDGTTYTDWGNIEDITPAEISSADIKTTKLAATAHAYDVTGIPDYGEPQIKLRYSAALVTLVKGWMDNKTPIWIKTKIIDGTTTQSTDAVKAFIKNFKPSDGLKLDTEVISIITFRTNGASTFTAGT